MDNSSTLNTPLETPRETTPIEIIAKGKIATGNEINIKDNKVLPWDKTDHEIEIRSFSGYTVKFNGWIRHDVREQRLKERKEKESEENMAKEKGKETNDTNEEKNEINKERDETAKEQEGSNDKNI